MTKLEEVARAICAAPRPILTGKEVSVTIGDLIELIDQNGYLNDGEGEIFGQAIARAAVEAMREPTEAMCAATDEMDIYWSYEADGRPGGPADVYRAMIDAILNEKAE